jgi:hypothetical protein
MVKPISATNHSISVKMPKKKTSLNIDSDVWKRWLTFVIQKTGSSRKISSETVRAIEEYMRTHSQ